MKKIFVMIMALTVLVSGCSVVSPVEDATVGGGDATVPTVALEMSDADMFTQRDSDPSYDESESVVVLLQGDRASCDAASVIVDGTTVTITGEGCYILRGTLEDGQVVVTAGQEDKLQLVLDGASITSKASAALYISQADKVFVTSAPGSENALLNGGSFQGGDGIDGALFSRDDLTLNGSGTLRITSPGGHGIVCKDDLVITGGSYDIVCASHGLDANDSIRIKGATLTVDAGKDGIHADDSGDAALGSVYLSGGSCRIEAEGDGISASSYLQMVGGSVEILAGGGSENGEDHSSEGWGQHGGGMPPGGMRPGGRSVSVAAEEDSTSMKGLKAQTVLQIQGGSLTIDSADDGLHSDGSVSILGGDMKIASGDDGIHAETTLSVWDGTIHITESYEGLEALDIWIGGGEISLIADDDGLNAAGGTDASGTGGRDQMGGRPQGGMGGGSNGSIVIDGGELYVQASGDGMDANGSLQIDGGYTVVCGPNSGDTATLDYDTTGTITGGTFIGTGAMGMAQTFSTGGQGVLSVSVGQGQPARTQISVSDGEGKVLIDHTPELPFSVIIISTPDMVSGETYHVKVGQLEGEIQADMS